MTFHLNPSELPQQLSHTNTHTHTLLPSLYVHCFPHLPRHPLTFKPPLIISTNSRPQASFNTATVCFPPCDDNGAGEWREKNFISSLHLVPLATLLWAKNSPFSRSLRRVYYHNRDWVQGKGNGKKPWCLRANIKLTTDTAVTDVSVLLCKGRMRLKCDPWPLQTVHSWSSCHHDWLKDVRNKLLTPQRERENRQGGPCLWFVCDCHCLSVFMFMCIHFFWQAFKLASTGVAEMCGLHFVLTV